MGRQALAAGIRASSGREAASQLGAARMKVLELTQRFPPAIGGVEQHVLQLALRLPGAGWDVEVVSTDLRRDVPFERIPPGEDGFPFSVTRLSARKFLDAPHGLGIAAPGMMLRAIKARTDVVHAHGYGYFPTWAGSMARCLDRAALVVTPHSDAGTPTAAKRLFDRVLPALTLRRAHRVIAVSRHEADRLESLGVPADRIAVIPNGVDLKEFREGRAEETRAGVTALFVGRLDPSQKGLDTLIRAMGLLRSSGIRLRLVGEDWGGAAVVRDLARKLGVADRVTLVGCLDRGTLLREYSEADFLVLPSRFEPFGVVLLEAMASGLPVVASRVGGIPEVVEDGTTGLLADPGDERALAAAMSHVGSDAAVRARMGRSGRMRAAAYSWDAIAPRVAAVYREAAEEAQT